MTLANCVSVCSKRENCGHVIFCKKFGSCYIEDDADTNTCDVSCDSCVCYDTRVLKNIAFGAQCDASSVFSPAFNCTSAIDGASVTAWASKHEGVGAWIKIDLGEVRLLKSARLFQRYNTVERNKDISLKFSDGTIQQFRLEYVPKKGYFSEDIDLQPVRTKWVNVTVLSVYTTFNNGWLEIELYGFA